MKKHKKLTVFLSFITILVILCCGLMVFIEHFIMPMALSQSFSVIQYDKIGKYGIIKEVEISNKEVEVVEV